MADEEAENGQVNAVRRLFVTVAIAAALFPLTFFAQELTLPNRADSVKFAAMGDNGTGDPEEYDVASQMNDWHKKFRFDFVLMLGDNMYGSQRAEDFVQKFERPYKPLLDTGVKFYACLGNHEWWKAHWHDRPSGGGDPFDLVGIQLPGDRPLDLVEQLALLGHDEREGDAVPKLPNARDGLKSDVELKFAPSSMMKRELFGG